MTGTGMQALAVALGAALGGVFRWLLGVWLNTGTGVLAWGTWVANVLGGMLIGGFMAWFAQHPNEWLRLLLVTGFLGGLTTFSTFSAESLAMVQRGQWAWAAFHALWHVLAALAAAALGHWLVRQSAWV